ncbi:helix-turn-helix transcriptional regulator [Lysobacter sp. 22409]|uniref:helix-turn-helix transcriptional regulator n=1 Tax=Lysobacter sp. 22409 TaxID=3453917 RepID=UPI003F870B1D
MLKTSTRLLRLLSLLQQRRHWTGAELCERLEVEARTVRRDVERLRELGYPIQASVGVGGGYQLSAGTSLPPLLLDDDEAVAVAVALRSATGSVSRMEDTALGLLSKLDQLMPARLRRRVSALYSVTVSLSHNNATPDVDTLTHLATACRDHLVLKLGYRDRTGKPSTRNVEPLRMAHTGQRWYLVAWDRQREDWRTFRIDRIAQVQTPGPSFVPRTLPEDVATYVERSIRQPSQSHRLRARLQGSAEALATRIPSWCGVLEAVDDDYCLLHVGADSVDQAVALLAMTGVEFEILDAPEWLPQLREVVARLQRAMQ